MSNVLDMQNILTARELKLISDQECADRLQQLNDKIQGQIKSKR